MALTRSVTAARAKKCAQDRLKSLNTKSKPQFKVPNVPRRVKAKPKPKPTTENPSSPSEVTKSQLDKPTTFNAPPSPATISMLHQVKFTFSEKPLIYQTFLQVLKQTLDQPLTEHIVAEVGAQIQQLFAGYPELIHAFNQFMPDGNKLVPI